MRSRPTFRPDIDLLTPIGQPAGQLSAQPGKPTKMGAAHHGNGILVLCGQREKPVGGRQHLVDQPLRDTVAGEIEEPNLMGDLTQHRTQPIRVAGKVYDG